MTISVRRPWCRQGGGPFPRGAFGEGDGAPVGLSLRFFRQDIEGLKPEFVAQIEGREIEPKSAPATQMAGKKGRQRSSPKADDVREVASKLWPDGVPKDLANDRIVWRALAKAEISARGT
jgi:hypothetical protein